MITVNVSKNELEVIIAGLRERETRMYNDSIAYGDQGNRIAQLDCLGEMNVAHTLRERLESLAR
jgi:hypothetical protein